MNLHSNENGPCRPTRAIGCLIAVLAFVALAASLAACTSSTGGDGTLTGGDGWRSLGRLYRRTSSRRHGGGSARSAVLERHAGARLGPVATPERGAGIA